MRRRQCTVRLSFLQEVLPYFLADRTYGILTEDHWKNFVVMLENRCFEVYEGREQETAREGDRGDIGAPAWRVLTLKETLERLHSRYYELEEAIDPEQRENTNTMNIWLIFVVSECRLPYRRRQHIFNVERERREAGREE
ncbi:hypothetical protein V1520DRAFT_310 [Lipomyces starkeyi]|uniref:Uncharacterized protein n=1 Tax=Lipomyces starkeyi NRRL Y-11557 TaxID=675824 RepID=A0A1E3Q9M0_LIPST|nr:hypothetical protein LIPSTDRAFT_2370 [Lipomyces starkeyi NRRL Y-11557]